MKVLRVEIELLEPILLSTISGDSNSSKSLDYIPGSSLRGALIEKFIALRKQKIDASVPENRRMFFDGSTRYLNAYPMASGGKRSIPFPVSFRTAKDNTHFSSNDVLDFASNCNPEEYSMQWKNCREGYCEIEENSIHSVEVERTLSVHTARSREQGRPGKNEGGVYHIDALAAGQSFVSFILCEHDEDAETLRELVSGIERLGGSRGGGYGRVRLTVKKEASPWQEVLHSKNGNNSNRFVISCLSHLIMLGENGDSVVDRASLEANLQKRFGKSTKIIAAFLRTVPLSGFNKKWGTPLPQELAIQAGSVFVMQCDALNSELVAELEINGLGEKLVDGCGRVAINLHGLESVYKKSGTHKAVDAKPADIKKDTKSYEIARRMVNRLASSALEQQLTLLANQYAKYTYVASSNQLNRLRGLLEHLISAGEDGQKSAEKLEDFLKSIEERQVSRKQFEKMRINNKLFFDWMKERIVPLRSMDAKSIESLWEEIHLKKTQLPSIGGVKPDLGRSVAVECSLRLIHGVIVRATANSKGGR